MVDWIKNISNKDILQENLTFVSLYIAIFENMTDYVVSNLKSFLCDFKVKDGNILYIETDNYKNEIKNRIVDDKGNKDITKASFLWLLDNGAIEHSDYDCFLNAKMLRNKYAHELTSVIYEGVQESEIQLFFDMFTIYQKISKWYFINIEAVLMGEQLPENTDALNMELTANVIFKMVLEVLYSGKSEEYRKMFEKFENGIKRN